jgi:hypothetical protein
MPEVAAKRADDFDFIKPFRYLFDNPNAGMNLLFACLAMLIPIVGSIVQMGWYGRIVRALARQETPEIPALDFNLFVEYLKEGLLPFAISFVIVLPFTFLVIFLAIACFAMIPWFAHGGDQVQPFLLFTLVGVGGMVLLAFMLLICIITNAALTRAYLTADWGKAMEFGKIFSYARATWRSVVTAWVVYLPVSILLMVVGMLAFYLGIYPASVIMSLAWLHFMWQIYERYLAAGGEAIPCSKGL